MRDEFDILRTFFLWLGVGKPELVSQNAAMRVRGPLEQRKRKQAEKNIFQICEVPVCVEKIAMAF